jgi:hypothetical protein
MHCGCRDDTVEWIAMRQVQRCGEGRDLRVDGNDSKALGDFREQHVEAEASIDPTLRTQMGDLQ